MNCLDSIDRTNVALGHIALKVFGMQLVDSKMPLVCGPGFSMPSEVYESS